MTVQWVGPQWLRRPAESLGWDIYTRATSLSLTGPKCDDRLIEHLVKLKRLESLTLSSTGVSDDGVTRLRKALPNCQIRR